MSSYVFVCYPKCSTCKKAQKWLDEHGVDYELRDIKLDNPTTEELKEWHENSGLPIRRLFNTSGMKYRELGLKDQLDKGMSEEDCYKVLSTDGMLVKRPILIEVNSAATPRVLFGFKESEWDKIL